MKRVFGTVLALASTLLTAVLASGSPAGWEFAQAVDRVEISYAGEAVATYVYRDPAIRRPYFSNLRALDGVQVTRNHPPVSGLDPTDHDTMHPGLWLAFGDINGADFWRNRGRIEHVRFAESPRVQEGRLSFVTECRLLTANGGLVCSLNNRYEFALQAGEWLLVWDATFRADAGEFAFGDQEEMGFGVRVATELTEKNGGRVRNSGGSASAKATWGQPAAWCDYSGATNGRHAGILVMADPANFQSSWWHNRDYGLMVANPFGREAMKQGEKSSVTVKAGDTLRLRFGAMFYSVSAEGRVDCEAVYRAFVTTRATQREEGP